MKLRIRRRVAKAALWAGIVGGVLIAAFGVFISLTYEWLFWLNPTAAVVLLGSIALSAALAFARYKLRRSAEITGLAWWLAISRFAFNFALLSAGAIILLAWVLALVAGSATAPELLKAMILTVGCSVVTSLILGSVLDLTLLLGPTPEKPAAE